MTPTAAPADNARLSAPSDDETGVPGLWTWNAVYALVAVIFLLWVVLLEWLTRAFS